MALPSTEVDLIESAGRKTAVAARLAQAADVANARPVTARAEEWAGLPPGLGGGREAYDVVTARAVAPLAVLVEYAAPLLRAGGVLVAWKGGMPRRPRGGCRGAPGDGGEGYRAGGSFEGAGTVISMCSRRRARHGGVPRVARRSGDASRVAGVANRALLRCQRSISHESGA